jgi:HlyD family secretion protein
LILPTIDRSQGTVEVRIAVPDPPDYLRADMTVSVNIEAGRSTGASVLPEGAVQGLGAGDAWVGVVVDGRLERREVEVGLRAGDRVEIVSGLSPGEVVAIVDDPAGAIGERVRVSDAQGG